MLTFSIGPLKGLRFRFAKTRPGEGGGTAPTVPNAALDSLIAEGIPVRTRRMLEGKLLLVGVAGRTLMLLCGDLASLCVWLDTETVGEVRDAEDVEEAFECE